MTYRMRKLPLALAVALLSTLIACGKLNSKANAQPEAGLASPTGNWSLTPVAVDMGSTGNCPSVPFFQVPGQPDLFLGRTVVDPASCVGGPLAWTLALYKMDWATSALHFVKALIDVPTLTPSGFQLKAALDPTAAEYRGEVWVAFECVAGLGDTSSCVAPLDPRTDELDLSRLSAPVRGVKSPSSAERFSASEPKLVGDNGHLYIYWTVVDHVPSAGVPGSGFRGVTARGAELVESSRGVLQAAGAPDGYLDSTDPNGSVEVLHRRANDSTADALADISDVKVVNGRTLAAVAMGGSGSSGDEQCTFALSRSRGCHHLEIHEAATPLGDGAFDREVSGDVDLPYNPAAYARFIVEPDGKVAVIGRFYPAADRDQTHQYATPGLAILTSSALH
jgi:hypothetical protein